MRKTKNPPPQRCYSHTHTRHTCCYRKRDQERRRYLAAKGENTQHTVLPLDGVCDASTLERYCAYKHTHTHAHKHTHYASTGRIYWQLQQELWSKGNESRSRWFLRMRMMSERIGPNRRIPWYINRTKTFVCVCVVLCVQERVRDR